LADSAWESDRRVTAFFRSRWRGEAPLARVFWTDTIVRGTMINIAAALLGLFLFTWDAPTALAASVYFAPLPYNVFLLVALFRAAAAEGGPWASAARAAGAAWFVLVTLI
jgi:hypothetical protein